MWPLCKHFTIVNIVHGVPKNFPIYHKISKKMDIFGTPCTHEAYVQDDLDIEEEGSGFINGQEDVPMEDIVLRFHLVLEQSWNPELADSSSTIFSIISTDVSEELQKLFSNVPGKQQVVVAEFRYDFDFIEPNLQQLG